jgi:hypothetical protein
MPSSESLSGLIKSLGREEWRAPFEEILDLHLGPACEDAGVELNEIVEILGDHHFTVLWGCAFEDFLTRDCGPDERNIVDDYLKRRGWNESVVNRRYMEALRNSTMSLYEVSDIVAGQSFLARDLVRGGQPIRISERSATRTLADWERIGARVVELNSKMILAGGLLPFTHAASEELIELLTVAKRRMRRALKKLNVPAPADLDKETVGAVSLAASAPLFTNIWLDDALPRVLAPNPPTIVNHDGDEIVFCTARYPLASGTTQDMVRMCLRNVSAFREASESLWNWVEDGVITPPRRGARPATKPPVEAGQIYHVSLDDGATVLGTIELADGAVIFTTNSQRRAQRGQALLTPLLGGLVRAPLTKIETAEQAMASPQARAAGSMNEIPPDLQAEIVRATLDKQYRETLDQPVGMLGDISPRAAARTKKGREKLVDWLKFLENQTGRHRDMATVSRVLLGR